MADMKGQPSTPSTRLVLLVAALAVVLIVIVGMLYWLWPMDGPADEKGFAIYLLAEPLSTREAFGRTLETLRLAERPILRTSDIRRYRLATHEMILSPAAFQRIQRLDVPMSGVPFVVCVDGEPVYLGAFWTSLSSASFEEGVVIDVLKAERGIVTFELGYPSPLLFAGPDPRGDPRIVAALRAAGVLFEE